MGQKGKMTLSSFLITLLILYLGFVLFKVIETAMTKEQIKSEVKNEIGMRRNSRMTPQDAEDIIVDFLESKNVIFTDDHDVTVNFVAGFIGCCAEGFISAVSTGNLPEEVNDHTEVAEDLNFINCCHFNNVSEFSSRHPCCKLWS